MNLFLKNIDNKTVFDIAIQNNYIFTIKILFKQIEEDNNKVKRRYMNYLKNNIFHKCTEYGQCYMVLFFYEKLNNFFKNFNLNKINSKNYKDQMNPLHIACYKGNKKIIKILLDLGIDINSKDTNGYTPLFYAIISKNENLVKMLILRGANKFIKDINNRTPYDIAVSMNEYNLVNLLYHRNFCQRQFCGDEITPLVKTKNHFFLLFGLFFTVFIKLIIIFRFICVFNNIKFDFFSKMYNNFYITLYTNENDNYINNTLTYDIKYFLNCIDYGCEIEVGIIFFTLIIDFFLLIIIIISKFTKKNIFLEKNYGKDIELTSLYENNKNICVKCRISINSSTTHCLICNRCVNNWDHHCYWLNSCVNDKNYIIFQLFLFRLYYFLYQI